MASIIRDPRGCKRILFVGADKKRRAVRLGKVSLRMAETVKARVEHLVSSKITGHSVDGETARWLAGLDGVLRDKLAAVGLVSKREAATLGAFLDGYLASRSDVKAGTLTHLGHTRRNLLAFFGRDKALRAITRGDADAWRLNLIEQGLADDTIRRRCGVAKQFFRAAVRSELVSSNPFQDLKSTVQGNKSRMYFVTREDTAKVLEACPDAEWRLMVSLARFGGLRCPSEVLGLRWGDIDWARDRFTVHSPKTEHHTGKDSRSVPLFPELVEPLREVFEQAADGAEYVITRYRGKSLNQRTQFGRIIRRAGLEPWPKPWQNLRSTRETELAQDYAAYKVCAWLGNSEAIAARHYLQITDEHYTEAAQKAAQYTAVHRGKEPQAPNKSETESAVYGSVREVTPLCGSVSEVGLGLEGFEPQNVSFGKHRDLQQSANPDGAESGALGALNPDLQLVIDAWLDLPETARTQIVEICRDACP